MSKSKIEWTDRVWNPISGCSKVSAGCKNCYAETYAHRFWGARKFTDIMLHQDKLNYPLTVKKPTMFFVNSMSDLFHEEVPKDFIESVFEVMNSAEQHTFQVLTKRPERMKEIVNEWENKFGMNKNIWFGVSVEDNKSVDRIRFLKDTKAEVKFISIEPLLENLTAIKVHRWEIDWVIIGCESGPKRRECELSWVTNLVDYFENNGIPIFVKQLSIDGKVEKDINKFPKDLQIREYPKLNQNTSEEKTK